MRTREVLAATSLVVGAACSPSTSNESGLNIPSVNFEPSIIELPVTRIHSGFAGLLGESACSLVFVSTVDGTPLTLDRLSSVEERWREVAKEAVYGASEVYVVSVKEDEISRIKGFFVELIDSSSASTLFDDLISEYAPYGFCSEPSLAVISPL